MADEITNCIDFKDAGVVQKYAIFYKVEDGANSTEFAVEVYAREMTDPDDTAEAKTLADVKATAQKAEWISKKAAEYDENESAVLNGTVTL